MTASVTASSYVDLTRNQKQELEQQLQQTKATQALNQTHLKELEQRRDQALTELLETLLPDLSQQSLQRAATIASYPVLVQRDLPGGLSQSVQATSQRVAALEADPRYRDRQLLRAPRVGTLTRAIDELADFRTPLTDLVARCAHPRLDRLMETGYGTPSYSVPFWRLSYYSDWRAGDEIVARFPDKKDFGQVREDFLSACSTLAVYDKKLKDLRDEVAAGEALESEIARLKLTLDELPQQHLQLARGLLGAFLRDSDPADLTGLQQDQQVEALYKRYSGLRHQVDYLQQAGQHFLQADRLLIQSNIDKLDKQIEKYSRPSKSGLRVPGEVVERQQQGVLTRLEKIKKHRETYTQTHYAVYNFEDYHRARLADDFLWWGLMGPRLHGDYFQDVSAYRQRYPHALLGEPMDVDLADQAEIQAAAAAARSNRQGSRAADASAAADIS